jgi:protein-disulfide isomerase/uncharacterized membrane protein
MSQPRLGVALLLLLLGAALSGLLLLQHHGEEVGVSAVNQLCGDGQTSGCEAVARSRYSSFAGVPLAAYGLIFYLSLAALLALAQQSGESESAWAARLALFACALALLIDVPLFAIQAIEIKAFCKLCLASYGVNGALAWSLWPARRAKARPQAASARLLLAGVGLSGLALIGCVFAAEQALTAREALRGKAILGAPAAGGSETLEQTRAELQKLQEILDDPRKYEAYLADKSAKEFDVAVAQELDTRGVPFKGPVDARIHVVEFSDFLCPYCRAIAGAFKDFLPQAQGRISIYFKNYPLDKECNQAMQQTIPGHEGSCWLAKGGLCAAAQDRFWEYHDKVFGAPPQSPGRDKVLEIGAAAGLDPRLLSACLDAAGTDSQLKGQIAEAERVGVHGTPTLFLNGKKLPRLNDFVAMVDKEGARLGLPPLAKAPSPAASTR